MSSCEQGSMQNKDVASLIIIFLGIFMVGIGVSFYYSFGIPYVDDNAAKTESPFLLSVVTAGRTGRDGMGFPPPGAILSVPPPGMILSVLPPWHKQGEGTHIHPPEAHKILKITRKTLKKIYNKTNIMN